MVLGYGVLLLISLERASRRVEARRGAWKEFVETWVDQKAKAVKIHMCL